MMFRSPTCADLSFYCPAVACEGASIASLSPYIETIPLASSSAAALSIRQSSHDIPRNDLWRYRHFAVQVPHAIQLEDGRYLVTFYEMSTIPEEMESSTEVYFVIRSSSYSIARELLPSVNASVAGTRTRFSL
jgi:hypothetical protein